MSTYGDFSASPGFKFALDSGLEAVKRTMAARGMLHSGNALSELMRTGIGMAGQEYGNWDQRRIAEKQGDQGFGLGMYKAGNDYALGQGGLANQAQGQWYDYDLGKERNGLAAAADQNQYNLNWFNADTSRGSAESSDWWNGNNSMQRYLDMMKRQA